jgi:hypothetical protein
MRIGTRLPELDLLQPWSWVFDRRGLITHDVVERQVSHHVPVVDNGVVVRDDVAMAEGVRVQLLPLRLRAVDDESALPGEAQDLTLPLVLE